MPEYQVLGDVVAIAGSLMAASAAIGLAWMRRAKWMPPTETVAGGTAKASALICAVLVAILYLLRQQIGFANLSYLAIFLLVCMLIGLGVSIYVNTASSFVKRIAKGKGSATEEIRILGGFALTLEAASVAETKRLEQQALFENANYKADLVWTKHSQATLQVTSTMGFVVLQVCGSLALATASMLISLSASKPI